MSVYFFVSGWVSSTTASKWGLIEQCLFCVRGCCVSVRVWLFVCVQCSLYIYDVSSTFYILCVGVSICVGVNMFAQNSPLAPLQFFIKKKSWSQLIQCILHYSTLMRLADDMASIVRKNSHSTCFYIKRNLSNNFHFHILSWSTWKLENLVLVGANWSSGEKFWVWVVRTNIDH